MTAKDLKQPKRILLGQLNSYGDCLYATAVARQIKVDYPGCHLTWAIGSMCRSILEGNPYVDEIWEIPLTRIEEVVEVWPRFEQEAWARKRKNDFDEVFLTQIAPGNTHRFDGMIRSSLFRGYPGPITVPVTPVLRLLPSEVENVRQFVAAHRLEGRTQVILFESSPKSGQSFITPDFALEVARIVVAKFPDAYVILSSNTPIETGNQGILDGSPLTLRETAELTKYCSLLVGGSSGVSWIATSDWAKPLPMIQLLRSDAFWFASVLLDYQQWRLPTENLIEMTQGTAEFVAECIESVFVNGFGAARAQYHEQVRQRFNHYRSALVNFMSAGEYGKATSLLKAHLETHGFRWHLISWYFYILFRQITPASLLGAARAIKTHVHKL
jgi:hypothetical protein